MNDDVVDVDDDNDDDDEDDDVTDEEEEEGVMNYRQIYNISRTQSPNIYVSRLVFQFHCPIDWSQVLSWSWRSSWSSADRRCFNYIWVINSFIAY